MTIMEFENEPIKGIPGHLPAGERLLWQGTPTWRSLMVHVLHVRFVATYFAAIMAWRAYSHVTEGNGVETAVWSATWLGVLGLLVVALMGGLALMMKRSTVYTITSKRVILRYGVVLPVAINLPLGKIETVGLKELGDGTGEIPLTVGQDGHLAYWMMWPHARRWHFAVPTPMLRSIPDARRVAGLLAEAITATMTGGGTAATVRAPARTTATAAASQDTTGMPAGGAIPTAA
jgi:hypothetical protein